MPASPELADRGRDIRIIEVLHKIKSKHFSQSDRHIRISRKIEINLKCVQNRQHPRIDRSQLCQRFLHHPVHRRRKGISKQHFFRQSVGKALDSIRHPLRRTLPVPNLFADIVILDDRSRDELRKEGNIERQMKDIFLRLNRPPVHIHHVGKRLKRVEGYSDRKSNLAERKCICAARKAA